MFASVVSGRLEEERGPVDAIDHPRMLAIDLRLFVTDHAPHAELGVDAQFRELAPRPQREIFAIASFPILEDGGVLPEVALAKQLEVADVLAGPQPRDDVVDGADADAALALEVPVERLLRAWPEHTRRHPHRDAVPRRFASGQTRGKLRDR